MASSPAASDGSHETGDEAGSNTQIKSLAVKDKECQYCHQYFTSSSLGRHLDQFISKKKPDGIHDVDEIKKLRAGITRRTARGGKKTDVFAEQARQDVQDKSGRSSPQASHYGATPAFLESLNKSQPGARDIRFNRMGWQSTGVITDPISQQSVAGSGGSPSLANGSFPNTTTLAGTKRSYSLFAADSVGTASNDTIRALELSLREVLDAVNVATRRAAPLPQPFPFELTSQTFPSLCLLLLPTPATLFQSTPFAAPNSIPLSPPGPDQLQALRSKIRATLDQWKWDALAHMQKHVLPNGMSVAEEAEQLTQTTEERIDSSLRHLETAYQYFVSNPPEQQYQIWSVELLRVYKTEQDKLKEAKEQIARITQEASQLQQQVDYLSRCQWPREMALWPPERNTFSSAVQKELAKAKSAAPTSFDVLASIGSPRGLDTMIAQEERWDFEKLVNKWKRHVWEDRARRGGSGATMLPPLTDAMAERTTTSMGALHRSATEPTGQQRPSSPPNSPSARNGGGFGLQLTDKAATFANKSASNQHMNTTGPGGSTASNTSNPPTSRTQTPFQNSNISIVSDLETTFGRFGPWVKQKELEERLERERERDRMAAGD